MIKKLTRKFVWINMSLIAAVMLIVFSILALSSYRRVLTSNFMTLERVIGREAGESIPPFEIGTFAIDDAASPDTPPRIREYKASFCVFLAEDGTYTKSSSSDVTVSTALLEQAVAHATAAKRDSGLLYGLSLRYLRRADDSGLRIAFVDVSDDIASMRNQLLTLLAVGVLGLGAFLLISVFLAKWALRPVARAWDGQRQFVADASHELKTPLTVILANTDILLSHSQDAIADHAKWLESTRIESLHMKRLVEDMLALAHADADRPKTMASVNLSDMVCGCQLSFESVAFERGVLIESDVDGDVVVNGDSAQLDRLLHILLDNAVKYACPGSTVRLSLHKMQEHAKLTVNNRGNVIPADDLPHIFERFYRADRSRSADGGFGLGLAIAAAIVQSHRGVITAESTEQDGTTFLVTF